MSKVNVDEIKVGDLVETMYGQERWLCYVTRLDIKNERYKGIWSDNFKEEWDHMDDLTGHWKVINFDELPDSPFTEEEKQMDKLMSNKCGHETFMGQCVDCLVQTKEEAKMDEQKIYTGKETIEALLEGKVLYDKKTNCEYKFEIERLLVDTGGGDGFERSLLSASNLITRTFTEVVTPQVGDWVRVSLPDKTITGCITEVNKWHARLEGYDNLVSLKHYWNILSPEQVSEYKREQAFVKVGRKPNEFRFGDIVYAGGANRTAIVTSKVQGERVKLHGINETKGYSAKPHQITPISFVEQQVDLS